MPKLAVASTLTLLVGFSLAFAQAPTSQKHAKTPQKPAPEEAAVPADPVAMQKWFGQAVGNILDGANRTLTGQPEPVR